MEKDLTRGSVGATMLKFALPMIFGNMLQQCYNIADTVIVGRACGEDALAAEIGSGPSAPFANPKPPAVKRTALSSDIRGDEVAHFGAAYEGEAVFHNIGGAVAAVEHLVNRSLDSVGFGRHIERVAQHH